MHCKLLNWNKINGLLKWIIFFNKCDRCIESVWNWFGLISRKRQCRGFFNIDYWLWIYSPDNINHIMFARLAEKIDEIQYKFFPKVRKMYFPSLYKSHIPMKVCSWIASPEKKLIFLFFNVKPPPPPHHLRTDLRM